MLYNKFKIEEINIGDEVYFDSTPSQNNHDLYWSVTGKRGTQLMIQLNYLGQQEYWTIDVTEVRQFIKLTPT